MDVSTYDLGYVLGLGSTIGSATLSSRHRHDLGIEIREVRVVAIHVLLELK